MTQLYSFCSRFANICFSSIVLLLLFCDFEDPNNILSEHKADYSEASSQLNQEK